MASNRVPFRRLASEFLRAGTTGTAAGWRSVGSLIDRNFEEISQTLGVSERIITGTVDTTNATPATVLSFLIDSGTSHGVNVTVVGRRTGGSAGTADDGAYYVRHTGVTAAGGVATLMAGVTASVTIEDQVGWDCTITVAGNTVSVVVTGAANNNITWYALARIITVS